MIKDTPTDTHVSTRYITDQEECQATRQLTFNAVNMQTRPIEY